MMDKDYKEKLEMEEHVLVPKRVYMTREEVFGITARCPWVFVVAEGDGDTSAHRKLPKAD